jgi:hypothetical protein
MAEINIEKLREELYKVSKALFCIGETCVDVSKQHISEEYALNKIRGYLNDAGLYSRFKVDQLIEDCMVPFVINIPNEESYDWLKECLKYQPIQAYEINYPACCDGCSNNPKNGGFGICNCTLPYMQNPTNYTVHIGDGCMANNTNGYVYFADNLDDLKQHKAGANRISEAIERTSKYIKR